MEKENRRKRFKTAGIMAIIFIAVYIPSLLHWAYGGSIATDIIRMGTLEDSINTTACLIRNENTVKSPYTGNCIANINEGERVQNNYVIATVIGKSTELLVESLKELDLKILGMQKHEADKRSIFSEDIKKLDETIKEKIGLLAYESNSGSITKTSKIESEINSLIRKKIEISSGFGKSNGVLTAELAKRNELTRQIQENKRQIIAPLAGTVSYNVDGYEEVLKPSSIVELTPEFFKTIKAVPFEKSSNNFVIQTGEFVAKLIPDYSYYYVTSLEIKDALKFKLNDSVIVRVNEINSEYSGVISYVSPAGNGKKIVVIRTDEGLSATTVFRKTNVDLIKCTISGSSRYKGLKVPLKSLLNFNAERKQANLVLVKANYANIRQVNILVYNHDFAIIDSSGKPENESISLYDTYVLNPGHISEGQTIRQ